MRQRLHRGLLVALTGGVMAGCGGTTSSSGASEVAVTRESLETIPGNLCAVKGHATNVGNLTIDVTIAYEAKDAAGATIGTSTASFRVAAFSDFDFGNSTLNNRGQPSSGPFSNGLACSGISDFKRVDVDVDDA
jgi:hypothetical protein